MPIATTGPDVKFSVFGDSACAQPLVVYTGVQDASGNDIVVKQQDLTVLDNGVCSDLNAEYVGQIRATPPPVYFVLNTGLLVQL